MIFQRPSFLIKAVSSGIDFEVMALKADVQLKPLNDFYARPLACFPEKADTSMVHSALPAFPEFEKQANALPVV